MRRLGWLLAVLAAAGVLWWAFWGTTDVPSDGKRVVRFLDGPDVGGGWKEVIEAFHKAHPDIRWTLAHGAGGAGASHVDWRGAPAAPGGAYRRSARFHATSRLRSPEGRVYGAGEEALHAG